MKYQTMGFETNNNIPKIKIGDRIELIRAADPDIGIKSGELGTVVDSSISKVVDIDGLRLVMWIRWDNNRETAIIDGVDTFEILR
jgi:hypothetical protein